MAYNCTNSNFPRDKQAMNIQGECFCCRVNGGNHQRDFNLKTNRFLVFQSCSTSTVGVTVSDEGPDMVKVTTAGHALCPPCSGSHFLTACHHIWTVTAHYHQSEQKRREQRRIQRSSSRRKTSKQALFFDGAEWNMEKQNPMLQK